MATSLLKPFQGKLSLPFTFGEVIAVGKPVYVYDDSGAKVKLCTSKADNADDFVKGYYNATCLVDTNILAVIYRDLADGSKTKIIAGEIQGDKSVVWGIAVTVYALSSMYFDICSHAAGQFCAIFRGTSNYTQIIAGTVDASENITVGTAVTLSVGTGYCHGICSPAAGKIAAMFRDASASNYVQVRAAIITGNVIGTPGTVRTLVAGAASYCSICTPTTDKIVIVYSLSGKGYALAATLTGTVVNAPGASSEFSSTAPYSNYVVSPATDKIVNIWRDAGDGYAPVARCTTLTGVVLDTWGDKVKLNNVKSYCQAIGVMDTDKIIFMVSVDATPYAGKAIRATISGKTIIPENSECFSNQKIYYLDCVGIGTDEYALIWYNSTGSVLMTMCLVIEGVLDTIGRCIGLTKDAGLLDEKKYVDLINGVSEQLTGMLPGAFQYIQCNGNISDEQNANFIGLAVDTNKLFITKTP